MTTSYSGTHSPSLVHPLGEVDVEADRKGRALPRELHRFLDRVPAHHRARAGDDPLVVSADDAAVDPARESEVVGVHDQDPAHRPTRAASRGSSARQSSACSGGGVQPGDQPSHCSAR